MNRLSWLLYWADVAPQVSSAICIISFFMTLAFIVMWVLGITDMFGDCMGEDCKVPEMKPLANRFRKFVWVWPFLIVLYISTWLVPDERETYYAIAASETGEELLKTPEIGKARQALNNWLDKQLAPEKETTDGDK